MKTYSTRKDVEAARAAVVARHGPWTAHDIALGFDLSTLDKGLYQQWRVDYLTRLVEQYSDRGVKGRRILDLACLEGLFAVEFARMGAATVGIEIREAHLAKARFAAEVNGLADCKFVQDDVRNLAAAKHGVFDIVLCAGILYHLDFPDCLTMFQRMGEVCRDLLIVDTHIATDEIETSVLPLGPMITLEHGQTHCRGRRVVEHAPNVTAAEKRTRHPWASIDNPASFWLTKEAIVAAMTAAGFEVCYIGTPDPEFQRRNPDRVTFVGRRQGTRR
jgi:ubiquinone/menaquinone biosynthesis C-methylase UbiE